MMRLAIMRVVEEGREVPVATRRREALGGDCIGESGMEGVVRWKYRSGTLPHVSGPMKDTMADWPGCRYRSNLWTSLGVLPAWEKICHVINFGTLQILYRDNLLD